MTPLFSSLLHSRDIADRQPQRNKLTTLKSTSIPFPAHAVSQQQRLVLSFCCSSRQLTHSLSLPCMRRLCSHLISCIAQKHFTRARLFRPKKLTSRAARDWPPALTLVVCRTEYRKPGLWYSSCRHERTHRSDSETFRSVSLAPMYVRQLLHHPAILMLASTGPRTSVE